MAAYNCLDSSSSAYGAGNYGTCTEQSVGAPDTGIFGQFIDGVSPSVIAPLAVVVLLVIITTAIIRRRSRVNKN